MNFVTERWRTLLLAGTLVGIIAFSAYLRFRGIESRPMHADEAVQAFKVGEMLSGGVYRYDPTDFHGPTLYFFAFWVCKILGIGSFAELSEMLVRAVPAVIGSLGCVAIPLTFFGRKILPVFVAGTLLAASALSAFYAGYFIQETLLVVFAWMSAGIFFFRRKTLGNSVVAGIFAGLAIASKETWVLMVFVFLLARGASLVFEIWERHKANARAKIYKYRKKPEPEEVFACPWRLRLVTFIVPAGIIATAFYTSFGKNLRGLLDVFKAFPIYFSRAGTEIPSGANAQTIMGLCLEEVWFFTEFFIFCGLLVIMLIPIPKFIAHVAKLRFPPPDPKPIAFFAVATLLLAAIYFRMPYTMPWLFLGVVPGIALLLAEMASCLGKVRMRRNLLIGMTVLWAGAVSVLHLENSPQLRYEHTSERVPEITAVIEKIKADFIEQGGKESDFFVAVIGPEYWPIPWYLRRERVGYWGENPDEPVLQNAAAIISADFEVLPDGFVPAFEFDLRRGVLLAIRKREPKTIPARAPEN